MFGMWEILKLVLAAYYHRKMFVTVSEEMTGDSYVLVMVIFGIVIAFMIGLDLLVRLYIGRSAIREGKETKKGWGYIVAAALYFSGSILGDFSALWSINEENALNVITSIIIDLTSCGAILDVIVSCLRLRRLMKATGNAGVTD